MCENIERRQLFTPQARGTLPSRSAEGESAARHSFGFRRHGTARGTRGGGERGGPGVRREQAPPAEPPIEQRRLLRMVATLALDRLQQLDTVGLFKKAAPAPPATAVARNAEAIEFPADLSTIRRRSQSGGYGSIRDLSMDVQRLLCSSATACSGTGSGHHQAAS